MKVMVTGYRRMTDTATVLDALARHVPADATILVGDCPTGVDAIVRKHWPPDQTEVYVADWNGLGRAAEPRRNQRMIDQRPDLVLAFPGPCTKPVCRGKAAHWSHDTVDAMRRAREAGLAVKVYSESLLG